MAVDWRVGGVALGLVFFVALMLVKPVGVSTQFVVADGIIANALFDGVIWQNEAGRWTSGNEYLAGSARRIADPVNYDFLFVLAMALGAGISAWARRGVTGGERQMPATWRANFGDGVWKRYGTAFLGGFIVLFAARLADGCTSGHMMSGMSQTAISGFIFAAGAFATAIPTALWLYKKEG